MHGAGNDYIYVNTLLYSIAEPEALSIELSKYHFGVGSDGLVLIGAPSEPSVADFSMRIFNADGSEAMMCGNASRCIGKYLFEKKLTDKTEIRLETLSGVKILKLMVSDGVVESITVDMLEPAMVNKEQFDADAFVMEGMALEAHGRRFAGTYVSMGNPHFVTFVDEDVEQLDIAYYGKVLEHHAVFPQRCNIEFAQRLPNGDIRMRVWERGSGITLACGTGACATSVAATLNRVGGRQNKIVMDGGALQINWDADTNHVFMTGPAAFVFDGVVEI